MSALKSDMSEIQSISEHAQMSKKQGFFEHSQKSYKIFDEPKVFDREKSFILWFNDLGIEDVPLVGGKNASLGEMYRQLTKKGINIPNGFAVTAYAYKYFLKTEKIDDDIRRSLKGLKTTNIKDLAERGQKIRELIKSAEFPYELKRAITKAYDKMCKQYGKNCDVAVRSSATAEDLPDASFAGQQETYLNIKGHSQLLDACKKCFASLFTDRAISYRADKKFDHFKIYLSIGIQKMVRSDKASAGVMFTIDTETGFRDVVLINASYGLGENVVQGAVNPDEYYVFKPTLRQGHNAIISKAVGDKKIKMIYYEGGNKTTKNVPTTEEERINFVLTDKEILTLSKWGCIIEDHYSKKAGHHKPMDIEWAKDGETDKLFIVQARPETVQSQKNRNIYEIYGLKKRGKIIVTGHSVGEKIGSGKANVIKNAHEISRFRQGEVLVTDMTDPDWEPIMKIASAIVTNRGGRTCFSGDTKILTNKGFMEMKDIMNNFNGLYVPSFNKETLKIEWKKILACMRRESDVIEVGVSQTGRAEKNTLKLTKDHKMLTFMNRNMVLKEVQDILSDGNMLTLAQKIPALTESTDKDKKLAYLLGMISTDGHIYLAGRHGEVQFVQKPTEEKKELIATMQNYMKDIFNKSFHISKKKASSGIIRGKPIFSSDTNAYRCYSKQIAIQMLEEQQTLVQTLLKADEELIFNFLAGVIDGDGTYNNKANRINIFCSKDPLLQSIVVGCLRLGIVPQIVRNRTIHNIQIVERVEELFKYTKRVKGSFNRKRQGTRFFSARQLLGDIVNKVNYKGRITPYVKQNLMIDADKIKNDILPLCSEEIKGQITNILNSDVRMQRVNFVKNMGLQDVYNITVEDNHNFVVFTSRYAPVIVSNCHAAIVSRELGIPCIVGTNNGTEKIKTGQNITASCAEGEIGFIYEGLLDFKKKVVDLKTIPKTRTKIMMNVAEPDQAFELSFIPNDGVGLAREEFIINSYIKIHPLALLNFNKLKDPGAKQMIEELTLNYKNKSDYFIDKLAQGVAMLAAAFYPKDVILRFSDFKTNEYANLIGGKQFEPHEENPMIGWRGASRYYSENYREGFALECRAIKRVRDEMGLTNLKVMIPFCRTIEEGKKVLKEMEKNGLKKGENHLQVYVMCEIPSNVILAEQFSEIFDGFSIGSNDLTQLTLGLDRDSELVSSIYDERNEAVKRLVSIVIEIAREKGRKIGICGQAPSDYPEFAQFLVECGIDSISLNPDSVLKMILKIAEKEKQLGIKHK